ncbi:MAG TPA: UDP-N-acetylmuramoyl-L-alanyl-D-glutamate--2,6-diaminopimelate ligase [Candidatus Kapabacteria bacterium]|nr:UDP-N-acetylmuramoyl-L-alanyl-D-glutamate--2,6-diaminopimelate ligase [Candidatus Kapabacteria bacterium]
MPQGKRLRELLRRQSAGVLCECNYPMKTDAPTLSELFSNIETKKILGRKEQKIHAVRYDSRRIQKGDLFVAVRGYATDGHRFIQAAIDKGASVIVVEDDTAFDDKQAEEKNITKIVVRDSRIALAEIANAFYGFPTRDILLIGVTGTNGKTTTTHIIRHFLEVSGVKTGLIGTIESRVGDIVIPMQHTTPESVELCEIIATMKDEGARAVVMEVSSHALELYRVHGFAFDVAVFTNLTQDHLDFHQTMEAYAAAKAKLFTALDRSAVAVINADDEYGKVMESNTQAKVIRYGITNSADVKAENVSFSMDGTSFILNMKNERLNIVSPYLGMFNVYNLLGGIVAAAESGVSKAVLVKSMSSLPPVRGRLERVKLPNGAVAVVDYAHTPDALQRAIETVREIVKEKKGNVITLFGCGGDRDRTKRPIMGAIAARLSDRVIVTSDNPRTENPKMIIEDVLKGVSQPENVEAIEDRAEAINAALGMAKSNDIVLLAGKGHEDYQIIGTAKVHFDDMERVRAWVARTEGARGEH